MAVHCALGLMHVVVAVLAPFAHAEHLARLVQPHDLARLAVPPHVIDLAVSLLVKDVLQPVLTPWHMDWSIALDRQGTRLLLHVFAPELS